MSEEQSSSAGRLPGPLRAFSPDHLRQVPGVKEVTKAAEGALNAVGVVSPRGRRVAAYTGVGLLGVAGVIEWPIAVAGAAAVWLTQPRPEEDGQGGQTQSKSQSKAQSRAKPQAKPQPKPKPQAKATGKAAAATSGGRSRSASGAQAAKRQSARGTAS
ncbi:hypothetical protein ABT381_01445 [Streptomyces sp. NPDC000151]|uniref:hypothetical protein n=1 Tax=Streptomyces sp. NPDC000151 TaxID=3154244 RepID=UPI003324A761